MREVGLLMAALAVWGLAGVSAAAGPAPGPQVVVSGDWTLTVEGVGVPTLSDLPALPTDWESPMPVARATIRRAGGRSPGWQVLIRRVDGLWPSGVTLEACLTDQGRGGTVQSPYRCSDRSFVEVGTQDTLFFWGSGNPSDVGIGLRLSGISVDVPPGIYMTAVVYTIVAGSP
ncbi:hypothetical protein [Geochorda subterranea]|uniref:Uncharacterized protein n=1 Tax=Geochorda subterranea TaxID=3109564 RepID=A0ABZ1BNH9_9FIRM|nr:hypothetical protein [Limnochorda sp. LNt]WRP14030.1 hypothetical protein VLY81_11445 [Limnochorda sp. LNt]